MNYNDLCTYKLNVYYKDSKVVRHYYFQTRFSLFRFICFQFRNPRVEYMKVVKLDV